MRHIIQTFETGSELTDFLDKNHNKINIIQVMTYSSKDYEWESSFNIRTSYKLLYTEKEKLTLKKGLK